MSYCKWGYESDLYVYNDCSGFFFCCSCSLTTNRCHYKTKSRRELIAHLKEHALIKQYCADAIDVLTEELASGVSDSCDEVTT